MPLFPSSTTDDCGLNSGEKMFMGTGAKLPISSVPYMLFILVSTLTHTIPGYDTRAISKGLPGYSHPLLEALRGHSVGTS